jgi:chromosome partitioning protein
VTKPSSSRAARSSSKPTDSTRATEASGTQPTAAQRRSKAVASSSAASNPDARHPGRARIIAIANQKGGVGKSTTAVSLGASLAELGYKVLVVDLDPQGNASTGLGIRHEEREVTVYDVLADEAPIERAIVPTPIDNLFAIPSTIDLAGAEIELVSQFSRELRLKKAIEPLKLDAFDFVFLDCPPSLGLLTVNALAAAEELIVPIQCEYYALEGLGQLLRNVRLVQQNVNTDLRLTGIVMTMFDPRTKLSEQVVAEVRRYFGDRVYRTIIPRTVRLSEAPGFGQPITVYDPHSKGAESYRDLAQEVASRLPDESPLPNVDDVPSVVIPRPEAQPGRAPRPLVGPEDRTAPSRAEPDVSPDEDVPAAADEDVPAMPDLGGEPAAVPSGDAAGDPFGDAAGEVSGELRDDPSTHAEQPGGGPPADAPQPAAEPGDEATQAPRVVEPPRAVGAPPDADVVSYPSAEPSPTVDQGSRDAVEELADLNGDRTQAEPEDDMQLDQGDSTDPGRKRRRGLFRRGGT